MADIVPSGVGRPIAVPMAPRTLDEARALARDRFKTRLDAGQAVGNCACHDETAETVDGHVGESEPAAEVAGVRFRDSGRTYYFAAGTPVAVGDWVVVETSRGREAGRVVIAPHQVALNRLQGDVKPILRRLGDDDVRRMEALKRDAATAVRTFREAIGRRRISIKPISAEYSFDGASLLLNYALHERERVHDGALKDLSRDLADRLGCRVELRRVGPRDEARLLGGLGRCGRTLCCSSWLPVYPEISMNMTKTQDLPLNPSKVSGVCGRLLCCLSYENEQYRQMKAVMPRLGQTIETPAGAGFVVSMQILKELVTVRIAATNADVVFPSAELGLGGRVPAPVEAPGVVEAPAPSVAETVAPLAVPVAPLGAVEPELGEVALAAGSASTTIEEPGVDAPSDSATGRRRRRRRGRRPDA